MFSSTILDKSSCNSQPPAPRFNVVIFNFIYVNIDLGYGGITALLSKIIFRYFFSLLHHE